MADGITLADEISCIRREIGMRESVYPRRVRAGKMNPKIADRETAVMKAVLARLEALNVGGRLI